jgi:hypothetical protein
MPAEVIVPLFIFLLGFVVSMSSSALGIQRLEEARKR